MASALVWYSQRSSRENFSGLTTFLTANPECSWNASLLTNLGIEYFKAGHYSKTLNVWRQAWELGKSATDPKGKAVADRAFGELVYMHARLGHIADLDEMLMSVEGRVFSGPATERVTGAREGLSNMQVHPEISFRCGPSALHRIMSFLEPTCPSHELIYASESTPDGCSLSQVAELSRQLGLNYKMAFREQGAAFLCPSVVHFKVDHFCSDHPQAR